MLQDKKILIVDDDNDILEVLQIFFESNNYITHTTGKGEEVNALANHFKPDAILLDIMLSGMDGREICKELKENLYTKEIPIIMISAHPDLQKTTNEIGADDFAAKPFDLYQLVSKVNKLIKSS